MTPLHERVLPTLMKDEGFREKPYRCPAGKLTIGYGTNIDDGIDADEAMFLLEHRVDIAILDCRTFFPWFETLSLARQAVIINLRYQLGMPRLRGFKRMIAALAGGDYDMAADELLDSKYARVDCPERAKRLAWTMRTGR